MLHNQNMEIFRELTRHGVWKASLHYSGGWGDWDIWGTTYYDVNDHAFAPEGLDPSLFDELFEKVLPEDWHSGEENCDGSLTVETFNRRAMFEHNQHVPSEEPDWYSHVLEEDEEDNDEETEG
jgi:hypothetical protein